MKWYYELHAQRFGPVPVDELVRLVEDGTITIDNLVWRKGMPDWAPLREAGILQNEKGEELAICAHSGRILEKSKLVPYGDQFVAPEHREEFVQNLMEGARTTTQAAEYGEAPTDFPVNVGSCFGRAWGVMANDFWMVVGVTALIIICISGASQIGAGIVLTIPLAAGLNYYFLRKVRGQPAVFEDSFKGFKIQFGQLMLMNLVITGIALGVVFLLMGIGILPVILMAESIEGSGAEAGLVIWLVGFFTFYLIAVIYLNSVFAFAPFLCIDKRMGQWDAIKLSVRTFHNRFFACFGFFMLTWLISIAGVLLLCIGSFVTTPWMTAAMAFLYEDIFCQNRLQRANLEA
ncbi:MAG: DUF4339 domain-containing protein [Verrucomicrobiales bacterium]|nr:DUF4339 domain-containing protein [Verrucomicrobiales bacterium]